MKLPADSRIGILPPGALGVAFAAHLSSGFKETAHLAFLPRSESSSKNVYSGNSDYTLIVDDGKSVRSIEFPPRRLPSLVEIDPNDTPQVILAGPLPDQLFSVLRDLVTWLKQSTNELGLEQAVDRCPILVMTSNGIYFQRLRRYYLELLEEAEMLGMLPELWPDKMPQLVGRLIRGVTIQTGLRSGSGDDAIYRPGPSSWTTLAGGDPKVRAATCALLKCHGMSVSSADTHNPTRVEFDKAIVNLASNLFGQILSISADGHFRRLNIGETHERLTNEEITRLVKTLVAIGKAVRAYPESHGTSTTLEFLLKATENHANHVASSVQLLESKIQSRTLTESLPPTEAWLLDPLINYARARHLEAEEDYLVSLKCRLLSTLRLAIQAMP